jgi:hypothetical protein
MRANMDRAPRAVCSVPAQKDFSTLKTRCQGSSRALDIVFLDYLTLSAPGTSFIISRALRIPVLLARNLADIAG